MAIQNIPLSFRLGGRDWKVTFVDSIEKGEVFAKWFDTKAEIQIAKNILDDDYNHALEMLLNDEHDDLNSSPFYLKKPQAQRELEKFRLNGRQKKEQSF